MSFSLFLTHTHTHMQDLLELDKFEWEPNEEARSEAEGVNFGSLSSHSRGLLSIHTSTLSLSVCVCARARA